MIVDIAAADHEIAALHPPVWESMCVQECARVCESMQEYARVCNSMQEYARVCKSVLECARVCESVAYMLWMGSVRLVSKERNCFPFLENPRTSVPEET